jgi:hypothetical protein
MQFCHQETGTSITDAIPKHTADHPGDVVRQSRRPIQPAGGQRSYARAQQPEEATDMIHVGMADEDIAHLVSDACGQTARLAEIEQQAALVMAEPNMQQGITENTIHQDGGGRTAAYHRPRSTDVAGYRIGPDIG